MDTPGARIYNPFQKKARFKIGQARSKNCALTENAGARFVLSPKLKFVVNIKGLAICEQVSCHHIQSKAAEFDSGVGVVKLIYMVPHTPQELFTVPTKGFMRTIFWVLLVGPPCLAALTWLMTRGWTLMMMRGRSTSRIALWQKYDFLVILAIYYVVMFTTALIEHKL